MDPTCAQTTAQALFDKGSDLMNNLLMTSTPAITALQNEVASTGDNALTVCQSEHPS